MSRMAQHLAKAVKAGHIHTERRVLRDLTAEFLDEYVAVIRVSVGRAATALGGRPALQRLRGAAVQLRLLPPGRQEVARRRFPRLVASHDPLPA
ncbi:hypothetical protein MTO96_015715 [Rhipicephalus appendiculatus]